MNEIHPPAPGREPAGPAERDERGEPAPADLGGAYQPATTGRSWVARSTMTLGLSLVVLGAAGCDTPGEAVDAFVRNGELVVLGTEGPDVITLVLQPGNPDVLQVDVGADGAPEFQFDRADFTAIVVRGFPGDDTIVADHTNRSFTDAEQTTFLGGQGDDTLLGSTGGEHLDGGGGADTVDGGSGDDTVVGGDGDDTFPWEPGDGSDVVLGGAGSDRSAVEGSNADEHYALSEDAGHAVLTRDIGSVTLDFDDVESLDVRTLGGTDAVAAGDVTGTDLSAVTADFAAAGGGDDGAADRLVVAPGLDLGRDGQAATVGGLGADVRVVNGAAGDHIHVAGTAGANVQAIVGTPDAEVVSVSANGTDVAVTGVTGPVFVNLTAVESLDVDLGGGTDHFGAVGNLAALIAIEVDGGPGTDSIHGSNGADVLRGGPGNDFVDGQQGADTIDGGDDADTLQWDPGDGSDTIVGGPGTDRMVFNGSNANESFAVSNVGGLVRFTRDVGSIVLDLDDVEELDVRALGGTDVLQANDVTGTDLATVTADFAGTFGGGDDGVVDRVVVDRGVTFGADGPVATVGGLGAQVRIANGSGLDQLNIVGTGDTQVQPVVGTPGADTVSVVANGTDVAVQGLTGSVYVNLTAIHALDVDLGDGDDSFSAVGNIAALAVLDVDGGPGADTILGSNGADTLAGGTGPDFVDGNQGIDVVTGGDGDDTFGWDPGDGTDDLTGGDGSDRLVFNGSNANENFEVSSIGNRVRLTRDIGSIVLGFDTIEALDVRALGGTDLVRVHDLTPTDLEVVTGDLAGTFGGGDDGLIDRVMVPVGVIPGFDGSAAVVDGLGARVRVVGGSPSDFIHIAGTGGVDTQPIVGTAGADTVSVTANGTDVAVTGITGPTYLNLSAVDVLDVDLGEGDDFFSGTGNLAALIVLDVAGDLGADTILGSNGADLLAGGPGPDFIDGQQGNDTVSGGDGDDTIGWDPGDGSDTIVGGPGTDRMAFNGSAGNESFEVSAVGDHVRFTRNLGNVVLELDEVEALDLKAFGGTDVLTVQPLGGTDLVAVNADLALSGGAADGLLDQIVVNGTDGPDTIALSDDGPAVVVSGLAATVRVTGADAATDRLTVNGLAGADTITASGNPASLIQLSVVP